MNPFVIIVGAVCLPLVASVILACVGRWMWAAAAMIITAMPLQLLGFTGTCTQGADGTFITGSILSAPLLFIAICFILWASFKRTANRSAGIFAAALSLILLALTRNAWLGAVFHGSPCGADYLHASGAEGLLIILGGYLALPILVTAGGLWSASRA
ncbi:hypothetical protein [Martelella mangrovi]|uniref:Signal transduction histidine kinase n=1 Tax=Martelella mangrovi TaxID=1397477 RepID=A0ABV2ICH8_9HYPH